MAGEDTIQHGWRWLGGWSNSIPRTLQTLYGFGDVVFEAEPFVPGGRASRVEGFVDELTALQDIFLVNERVRFELAVTEAQSRLMIGDSHGEWWDCHLVPPGILPSCLSMFANPTGSR